MLALQGWQGVQTIPRTITYDAELDELLFYPVVEVEQLRQEALYEGNVTLDQVGLITLLYLVLHYLLHNIHCVMLSIVQSVMLHRHSGPCQAHAQHRQLAAAPFTMTHMLRLSNHCAVLCCAVLCCAVLCCAVLCCAVLCCAVLCMVDYYQVYMHNTTCTHSLVQT